MKKTEDRNLRHTETTTKKPSLWHLSAHFLRITLRWLTMTTTYFGENAFVAKEESVRERGTDDFSRGFLYFISLCHSSFAPAAQNPPKFGHFRFLFYIVVVALARATLPTSKLQARHHSYCCCCCWR